MITSVVEEEENSVVLEINFQIRAKLKIASVDQLAVLKERIFEPGIFVSKIISTEPKVEVVCKKVIFGKRADFNA